MHFSVADREVIVHDREQRGEIGDRFVVVDAQAAAHVDETERTAQLFEVLDDDVDFVAHVLEDVQLADLRPDMQMQADYIDILERADLLGVLEYLFI